jgi:hypothetical protein
MVVETFTQGAVPIYERAARWSDLVDFEIVPVIGSDEARRRALG